MSDDEKELKDQRVVTMMSPSELEAIDEWMFAHRIRSRGEAIRRLCQLGMVAERQMYEIRDVALGAETLTSSETQAINDLPLHPGKIAATKLRALYAEQEGRTVVQALQATLQMAPFVSGNDFDKAMGDAKRIQAQLAEIDVGTAEGRDRLMEIARSYKPSGA